ncbi:MAG: 5-deoxy-glucuronate isomerase [Acidobacteria bacterium]|nr:MAG: 5-deoxy-glucuronate isomerase [Acidobacteriota bacterium]
MTSQTPLYRSMRVPAGRTGAAVNLTPRALGWDSIHFAVRHLPRGAVWSGRTGREERCVVLLRGLFSVGWGGGPHRVGPRADVFAGYPHAVYLPAGTAFRIVAERSCEVADCRAPASASRSASRGRFVARVIGPADCGGEIRGGGNATRQIVDIVPPGFPAERLLLCEVYTPGGNWSSYPPHKHDTDDPPREVDLDEIYYYRFRDPGGYGFQRLYTTRRDETLRVVHGDVVAIREGYHPFVTAHGYDAYYLNVLAGERRSMAASDDPAHARFRRQWPPPDPRLPMVQRAVSG